MAEGKRKGDPRDSMEAAVKKSRCYEESGYCPQGFMDRISLLPDSLSVRILDLLPIKDAARTCVLSKNWAYLWTQTEKVGIPMGSHGRLHDEEEYIDMINHTLILHHDSVKIKRFVVDNNLPAKSSYFIPHVDFRVGKGKTWGEEPTDTERFYLLPKQPADPNFFRRLPWSSLKSLSIGETELSNNAIETILKGSPALEQLELRYCWGFDQINISSKSVKKFVLHGYGGDDSFEEINISPKSVKKFVLRRYCHRYGGDDSFDEEDSLEISGTRLLSLEISGCLKSKRCKLMSVSYLLNATLNFSMHFDKEKYYRNFRWILDDLQRSLLRVKELTIGTWCLKALSLIERVGGHWIPPSEFRQRLTIETDCTKTNFPGIANLFTNSPNLEKLVIKLTSPEESLKVNFHFNGDKFWPCQRKTILEHLKSVEILGFAQHGTAQLLPPFVEFILENARVLETMIIHEERGDEKPMSEPQKLLAAIQSRKLFDVQQRLYAIPKSSKLLRFKCRY